MLDNETTYLADKTVQAAPFNLHFWISILTNPLGILLNMLAMYVFSRPNLNKTNMGFYYMNMSFYNSLCLAYFVFFLDSKASFGYDLSLQSDVSCAIITFFRRVVREIPNWIEALITLDRYLTICHPGKFNLIKTKRNFTLVLILITVLLGLLSVENLYYFLSIKYVSLQNETLNETLYVITTSCGSSLIGMFVSDLVSISLRTLIPGVLMCFFSFKLLIKVKRVKRNVSNQASTARYVLSFKTRGFTFSVK
jgi:hypothetical protein